MTITTTILARLTPIRLPVLRKPALWASSIWLTTSHSCWALVRTHFGPEDLRFRVQGSGFRILGLSVRLSGEARGRLLFEPAVDILMQRRSMFDLPSPPTRIHNGLPRALASRISWQQENRNLLLSAKITITSTALPAAVHSISETTTRL